MKQIELGGVESYLKSFFRLSIKSQPTYAMLQQLKGISQLIQQKKSRIKQYQSKKQSIQKIISQKQLQQYQILRVKKMTNQYILKVLIHGDKLKDIFQNWVKQKAENIETRTKNYGSICEAIYQFQNQINSFVENINIQPTKNNQQKIINLKQKFYNEIMKKLTNVDNQYLQQSQKLKAIFNNLELPLRRNKSHFSQPTQQQIQFLTSFLHYEACSYSLKKILNSLSQSENNINNSIFFGIYWQKIIKAITYHFLSEGQNHNIEQPIWLFQYLQQTFNINFKYFIENVFKNSINNQIKNYFLNYNFQYFFYCNIMNRLQIDIKKMNQFQVFNFLDEVYQFEQKICITFNCQLDFIEKLLLNFNKSKILSKNFIYEHKWIQQKVFVDFYNMNYSNINLKNLQAYNVVLNYISLFERLYSKFRKVKDIALIQQIQQFYKKSILQLIAHIKTSLERIYQHSGLNKFEIISAYKRVQNEFRGYFGGLLNQIPVFQAKVQQQYYNHLSQFFILFSQEQMNSVHKKLSKKLTQFHELFSYIIESNEDKIAFDNQKQQRVQQINKIYKQWQLKVENLRQIQNYTDQKIKNIFFVYLSSIQFTINGYNFFRQIFQPFLADLFTQNGLRILSMLLDMDKVALFQYLQQHNSQTSFLTSQQINSIKKITIK